MRKEEGRGSSSAERESSLRCAPEKGRNLDGKGNPLRVGDEVMAPYGTTHTVECVKDGWAAVWGAGRLWVGECRLMERTSSEARPIGSAGEAEVSPQAPDEPSHSSLLARVEHLQGERDALTLERDYLARSCSEYVGRIEDAEALATQLQGEKERLEQTASWLFGAFVSGVASKDVSERRMTAEQAASWRAHTVREFETNLRECAGLDPNQAKGMTPESEG